MQGPRLALLLCAALCCVAFAGCGGGGDEGTGGAAAQTARVSQGKREALSKLEENTKRIQQQRSGATERSSAAKESASAGPKSGSTEGNPAAQPDPRPSNTHHDSGSGTAQFATKEGDNSIQEFGQEAGPAEAEEAAAVLHAYLDARVAHNWEEACFYLSAGLVATIEFTAERYADSKDVKSCADVLELFSTHAGEQALRQAAEVDVGGLRAEGERAFLLYHGVEGRPYAMPMVHEGTLWKVGAEDGVPLF